MIVRLAAAIALVAGTAMAGEHPLNRLADAPSPYLRQHADNPVDWFPWGPEALAKAREEGKPILVSVGYAACHWCHVMREESFESEAIAAILNDQFVAIKIDRERRPDLDEQFMVTTQLLTGSGGWPTTVFLTPQGDPFFAGTYFPPETFQQVLFQVATVWREDPGYIAGEAAKVTAAVAGVLDQTAAAREVTAEAVSAAAAAILEDYDPFDGGFGTAPKFPREAMLLFLLDEAERSGDADVLAAVTGTLDGMIRGGIHDQVGGGFHRYAIDPNWHVPQFEKMLYNQALTGRLLTRAFRITGAPRYARAAERLFAYVLRDMRAPGGGFFSAEDADQLNAAGEREEGAFFTWTPAELAGLDQADAALIADLFQVEAGGDLEGRNVLALRAPLDELAAGRGAEPAAFTARLDAALDRLRNLRASRSPPLKDTKIVLGWNALMVATLAEAAEVFDRPDYRAAADAAMAFLRDEMRTPKGLARVHFDGLPGVPAQLPDYAALGLALIALHDTSADPARRAALLAEARGLAADMLSRFGDPAEGLRMTETTDGLSPIRPVDDAEIPSGNGLALDFLNRLARRMPAAEAERAAARLAGALSGLALEYPGQRAYALGAIAGFERGGTGPHQFAAKGAVEVLLRREPGGKLALELAIADGWHVNAHEPLEEYFIATTLTLGGADLAVAYPVPEIKRLRFSERPLALYEGGLRLGADLPPGAGGMLALTLQACSDEVCLQPEELRFALW